ncbi:MAG: DUF4149 domain-containing protein [Zetaproteobacteria bacterium]|nr:MAG: DUF4149 domain-containing protein [Zetaproteobacteria bacterium]
MPVSIQPACIQVGAARLALALVFGLLVVSGYVVAPQLFAHAGNRHLAGDLAGHVFHLANIGALMLLASVAGFWWRMGLKSRRSAWLVLLLLFMCLAINEFAVAPVIAGLKAQRALVAPATGEAALPHSFAMWHGLSSVIHLLATLLAAWLVASAPQERNACSIS